MSRSCARHLLVLAGLCATLPAQENVASTEQDERTLFLLLPHPDEAYSPAIRRELVKAEPLLDALGFRVATAFLGYAGLDLEENDWPGEIVAPPNGMWGAPLRQASFLNGGIACWIRPGQAPEAVPLGAKFGHSSDFYWLDQILPSEWTGSLPRRGRSWSRYSLQRTHRDQLLARRGDDELHLRWIQLAGDDPTIAGQVTRVLLRRWGGSVEELDLAPDKGAVVSLEGYPPISVEMLDAQGQMIGRAAFMSTSRLRWPIEEFATLDAELARIEARQVVDREGLRFDLSAVQGIESFGFLVRLTNHREDPIWFTESARFGGCQSFSYWYLPVDAPEGFDGWVIGTACGPSYDPPELDYVRQESMKLEPGESLWMVELEEPYWFDLDSGEELEPEQTDLREFGLRMWLPRPQLSAPQDWDIFYPMFEVELGWKASDGIEFSVTGRARNDEVGDADPSVNDFFPEDQR